MIFEDPSRRRWRLAVLVLTVLVTSALTTLALAAMGVVLPVELPDVFQKRPSVRAKGLAAWKDSYVKPVYSAKQQREQQRRRNEERRRRARLVDDAVDTVLPLPERAVVAFTVRDDAAAHSSLERHLRNIDVVVPDWFSIPGPGCELEEHIDAPTQRIVNSREVMVMPRIANLSQSVWRGEQVAQMMRDDSARKCLVDKIVGRLAALEADGVNVDIEELAPEDSEPLLELLVDLKNALHKKGMRLTVDVSFYDPAYDLEYIGQLADAVFVMAYDQHYPASQPGPISGEGVVPQVGHAGDHARRRRAPDRGARGVLLRLGSGRGARRRPRGSRFGRPWTAHAPRARCPSSSARPRTRASRTPTSSSVRTTCGARTR